MSGRNPRQANVNQQVPPSTESAGLGPVLARNIRMLQERREREEASASLQERIANAITRFAGNMRFVYLHLLMLSAWVIVNLNWAPGIPRFDPSFVILAVVASVEAIFLSTFILIAQNRMTATAEKRAELDVQISLLTEHEVTRLLAITSALAQRLGVETEVDEEIGELKDDVAPEAVLDEIENDPS